MAIELPAHAAWSHELARPLYTASQMREHEARVVEMCAKLVEEFPHWLGNTGRREIATAIRSLIEGDGSLREQRKFWYMRDNHTFRPLSGTPKEMVAQCLEEFDAGFTFGMLCFDPKGPNVHASGKEHRSEFEAAALEALRAMERDGA
jgi:hypothetical protein